MKVLVDTNGSLFALLAPQRLSVRARAVLAPAEVVPEVDATLVCAAPMNAATKSKADPPRGSTLDFAFADRFERRRGPWHA